jgi:hypothetical protein
LKSKLQSSADLGGSGIRWGISLTIKLKEAQNVGSQQGDQMSLGKIPPKM